MFPMSAKSQPHTIGVWISEPILQPNGNYLVVVDSEGTETGDTSQKHKILGLVVSFSSSLPSFAYTHNRSVCLHVVGECWCKMSSTTPTAD